MTDTTFTNSANDTSSSFCGYGEGEDSELSTCNLPKNDTFSYEHTNIQALFARACKDSATFKKAIIGNMPFADYRVELAPDLYATIELIAVPDENKYLIVPSHPSLNIKILNEDGSSRKMRRTEMIRNNTWLQINNVKVFVPKLRNINDKNHPLDGQADLLFEADRLVNVIDELANSISLDKPHNTELLVQYIGKLNISLIQRVHEGATVAKKEIIEAILADQDLNGKEEALIENFLLHHFGAEEIINSWIKELNFDTIEVRVNLLHNYAKSLKELLERFIHKDKQYNSPRDKDKVYSNRFYENIIHGGKNSSDHLRKLDAIGLSTKHAFKVRGTYFSCTDFFEMSGNRVGTFSIVSTKRFEKVFRLFYLSNSHCCFRLLPAVNHHGYLPKYDKAGNEVILAPPAEVQMNFAKILKDNKVLRNLDENIFENGVPENFDQDDWEEYIEQTILNPAKRSVQEIVDLIEPPFDSRTWRDPSEIKIIHSGESPNFSDFRGNYILNSNFIGKIKCYIFRSYNQEIEYIVSRTKNNEVWFSSITSLKGPLNNFGVPKIGVDAHELSLSLYEYTLMMDSRYIGELHPKKEAYSKVEGYHSNLSYLNEFKKRFIRSN